MKARHFLFVVAAAGVVLGSALPASAASAAPPVAGTVTYLTFDVGGVIPGAVDTNVTGLTATASTPGLVVGTYQDGTGRHGFIAHTGAGFSISSIETIDVGGSADVHVTSVNSAGTVSGYYLGTADSVEHGFIRDSAGTFTWLDDPSAVPALASGGNMGPPFYGDQFLGGTFPGQVTADGTVVGFYSVADPGGNTVLHGFTWTTRGTWTTVDAADAMASGGLMLGTQLFGMTGGRKVGSVVVNNSDTGTGTEKGLLIVGHHAKTYFTPTPLSRTWCGWVAITAINLAGTMAGTAGNGCSVTEISWLRHRGMWTALQYTDAANTATETIVSGLSNEGLVTGTWNTWPGEPGGSWLSPDNPAGYGLWHGFIAIPS